MAVHLRAIREVCTDLRIESVRVQGGGQRNVVLVINDALAFRFPRAQDGLRGLATEVAILRVLARHVPTPIPEPRFENLAVDPLGSAFIAYPWLPGIPLRREALLALGKDTQRHLAGQLGGFLLAMHTMPTDILPAGLSVQDGCNRWEDFYARVRSGLFPSMRPDARRAIERHFQNYQGTATDFAFRPALRHGDFGPTNILFDSATQAIGGIIDFESAGLGDAASDIAGLLSPVSYGEDFVELMESVYPVSSSLIRRARFYAGTFALQEALWGLEHHDQSAFLSGMAQYV